MEYSALDLQKIAVSTDYIAIYDEALVIRTWNHAAALKFSIAPVDAIGHTLSEYIEGIEEDYRIIATRKSVTTGKSFYFPSVTFQYTTGMYSHLILPLNADGKITQVMSVMREHAIDSAPHSKMDLLIPLLK
jgi:PAS domain-containing protein